MPKSRPHVKGPLGIDFVEGTWFRDRGTLAVNVFHVGDSGSGCVVKLVNNMLAFINTVVASEGMALGTKTGVDPYKDLRLALDIGDRLANPGATTDVAPACCAGCKHHL